MPKLNMQAVECNHCGKKVLMQVEDTATLHINNNMAIDEPAFYIALNLTCLTCSACNLLNITLCWEDSDDETVIYPPKTVNKKEIVGLPSAVDKAYKAAQAVRNIDGNAFAVLLRRLLETICIDRQASGKDLYSQIKSLAESGEIPAKLADMAHLLRNLGNVGAHASAGEITPVEIPYLDALCDAVLEYVYSAPNLIKEVEQRLNIIKVK